MRDEDKDLSVVRIAPENHDTTSIVFAGPGMERFKGRKAGQFAAIRVFRDGAWSDPHPFTLSSSPGDDALRMTIKKSGAFTSMIPDLEPGTPIQCAGPFGKFCSDIDERSHVVMIAGGVGITPFLSVLRYFKETSAANEVLLFWSNKTLDDAFAAAELAELAASLHLRVVHVLTRVQPEDMPGSSGAGEVSYESGRLDCAMVGRHLKWSDASFYICGPPPMQEAVLSVLDECGIDKNFIQKEAFVFKNPAPR